MKGIKTKLILLIMFLSGICILLYPMVSQYWNSKVQSQAITNYDKMLTNIEEVDYSSIFDSTNNYNQELAKFEYPLIQYRKLPNYNSLLNVFNNGMMGYINIDKIKVQLPIYHGTSSSVLNVAVGHLEGSSLPVGGANTHSVLSAHRGLPSAKLFTNLNKLEIGDTFTITILDRTLTYQVDQIVIVEPNDVSPLAINQDKDYVTLMTCTPYGINTHRLLVRGTRIDNIEKTNIIITSDAYLIDKLLVTLIISIPILGLLITYVIFKPVRKNFFEEDE